MGEDYESLLKIVNKSGFPLQIWLQDLIQKTHSKHGWEVVGREHFWQNDKNGRSGFIDLIVGCEALRAVIECKRVIDTTWIFLQPDIEERKTRKARLLWAHAKSGVKNLYGWSDVILRKETQISPYCVVRGQNENDKPMLERTASIVLDSTECLAEEETVLKISDFDDFFIYIPIIVTTAELQICKFSPSSIIGKTGTIEECDFTEIPFVNFRKGFSTKYVIENRVLNLNNANKAKERSVFIVNSLELIDFLNSLHDIKFDPSTGLPWERILERERLKKQNAG